MFANKISARDLFSSNPSRKYLSGRYSEKYGGKNFIGSSSQGIAYSQSLFEKSPSLSQESGILSQSLLSQSNKKASGIVNDVTEASSLKLDDTKGLSMSRNDRNNSFNDYMMDLRDRKESEMIAKIHEEIQNSLSKQKDVLLKLDECEHHNSQQMKDMAAHIQNRMQDLLEELTSSLQSIENRIISIEDLGKKLDELKELQQTDESSKQKINDEFKELIETEFVDFKTQQQNQLKSMNQNFKKDIESIKKALPNVAELRASIKKVQSFKVQLRPFQTELKNTVNQQFTDQNKKIDKLVKEQMKMKSNIKELIETQFCNFNMDFKTSLKDELESFCSAFCANMTNNHVRPITPFQSQSLANVKPSPIATVKPSPIVIVKPNILQPTEDHHSLNEFQFEQHQTIEDEPLDLSVTTTKADNPKRKLIRMSHTNTLSTHSLKYIKLQLLEDSHDSDSDCLYSIELTSDDELADFMNFQSGPANLSMK